MATWYGFWRFGNEPGTVEVAKETEHFLFKPNGRREAKVSEYCCWFPTVDEAVEHQRRRLTRNVESARAALSGEERRLAEFSAKHPPKTAEVGAASSS